MNKLSLLISLTLILIAFSQKTKAQCLIAHYPLNGNTVDSTGNGNNGIASGAVLTTDRFGNANAAYSFDGVDDHILLPAGNFLLQQYSHSYWVKPASIPANRDAHYIFTVGSYRSFQGFGLGDANNGWGGGGFIDGVGYATHAYSSPMLGEWYHIVGVKSDSAYKLYVNGTLTDSIPHSGITVNYGANPVASIGSRRDTFQYFHGDIDDVQIYDCVLTSSQIMDLANGIMLSLDNQSVSNSIEVYPNPTTDLISIENSNYSSFQECRVNISNSLGQLVYSSTLSSHILNIELKKLGSPGLYYVQLMDAKGQLLGIRKVILY